MSAQRRAGASQGPAACVRWEGRGEAAGGPHRGGEGTRRSHAGEGSAFWAVGVRDPILCPYLPT